MSDPLSPSAILSLMQQRFCANGYRVMRDVSAVQLPGDYALLAEDDYSLIAIVGFESWSQLVLEWTNAQASLVSLLSDKLSRAAPKAWDGYLLLFCTMSAPDVGEVVAIERDISRVRKIVATGDLLQTSGDVDRLLDPFVPLPAPSPEDVVVDVLNDLPDILAPEVPASASQAVIDAFKDLEPPLERLHSLSIPL